MLLINLKNKWKRKETKKYIKGWLLEKGKNIPMKKGEFLWPSKPEIEINIKNNTWGGLKKYLCLVKSKWNSIPNSMILLLSFTTKTAKCHQFQCTQSPQTHSLTISIISTVGCKKLKQCQQVFTRIKNLC